MSQGTIKRQVIVEGGKVAFEAGEQVEIESVQPNAQRPEYKYVVFSSRLQKRFQLSDNDVQPAPQMPPPQPVQQPVHEPPRRKATSGWRKVAVIAIVVVVAAGIAVGLIIGLGGNKTTQNGGPGFTVTNTWTNTSGGLSKFTI